MDDFYVLLYTAHRGFHAHGVQCIIVEQTRESFLQRVYCTELLPLDQDRGLGRIYSFTYVLNVSVAHICGLVTHCW